MIKEKTMIFITVKLAIAVPLAVIVTILLIPIRISQFLWHFFKMAYLFLWIRIRRRKMPLIIINNNGIDLEEIERMQNEKDENSKMILKFNSLPPNPANAKTECLNQDNNQNERNKKNP